MMTTTTLAPRPARKKARPALSVMTPVRYLFALLIVGVTLAPLLFVILGGFRSNAQINSDPAGLPSPWVFSNYATILASESFWRFLANSTVISVAATALAVGLGSMAAFALSRYRFRGREALYSMFTVGLLFPLGVAILPVYLLLRQLHLLESWVGVALPRPRSPCP